MTKYETYDLWYTQGGQQVRKSIEARSLEEAAKIGDVFLAEKRVRISITKRPDMHREPSSTPYPEFFSPIEAN